MHENTLGIVTILIKFLINLVDVTNLMGLHLRGHIYGDGEGLIFGMLIGLHIWGLYIWGGVLYTEGRGAY